jgi:hypothetical protein
VLPEGNPVAAPVIAPKFQAAPSAIQNQNADSNKPAA